VRRPIEYGTSKDDDDSRLPSCVCSLSRVCSSSGVPIGVDSGDTVFSAGGGCMEMLWRFSDGGT
jgi:hypothetical protein